jgi:hypothetical protein
MLGPNDGENMADQSPDGAVRPDSNDGHTYAIVCYENSDKPEWNGIFLSVDGNDMAATFPRTTLIQLQRMVEAELSRTA